jgi:alcohol dehydrogenase (cytochrome c)
MFMRAGYWYKFDLDASAKGGLTNPQGDDYPPIGAFLSAHQYVDEVSWTKGIDPKTGMPLEYDSAKSVQTYNDFANGGTPRENLGTAWMHCPDWGNQNIAMEPDVLDLERRTAYAITNDDCSTQKITEVKAPPLDASNKYFQGGPSPCCWEGETIHRGFGLVGMNIDTGERKKLAKWPDQVGNESGLVGTAGGLLMTAWPSGEVMVLSKDDGKVLWSFNTGTNIAAAPMTYAVGDKQYFAILAGGGTGSVGGIPDPGFALGGNPNLWVFGLPNK